MAIRSARLDDAAALATLWDAAGLHFRAEYVEWELRSALARNPDLVIVQDESPVGLAGSVFGTFDGRRGWLNRLATGTDRRGKALVRELECRLLAKGCVKMNLLIERDNADIIPFYTRLVYTRSASSPAACSSWTSGAQAPVPGTRAGSGGNVPADEQRAKPSASPSARRVSRSRSALR